MEQTILHASAVSCAGRAVVFTGPSGSGKSGMALEMMALGGLLVSDDRTVATVDKGEVYVTAPAAIKGLIEARGVGILFASAVGPVAVSLVVDMSMVETVRFPPERKTTILAQSLPLLYNVESRYFPMAILQYLRHGRIR